MGRAFECRRRAKESRWATMSKVFPKLAKSITLAAKDGGPDPESNARLRVAIANAKAQNLSRENIEAAIKRAAGKDVWNAAVDASAARFRPIMLTAISTVLGMIPIAWTVFWGPMAFAIMGGLMVATLLTLVFLPTVYVAVFGREDALRPAADTAAPASSTSA